MDGCWQPRNHAVLFVGGVAGPCAVWRLRFIPGQPIADWRPHPSRYWMPLGSIIRHFIFLPTRTGMFKFFNDSERNLSRRVRRGPSSVFFLFFFFCLTRLINIMSCRACAPEASLRVRFAQKTLRRSLTDPFLLPHPPSLAPLARI